MNAVGKRKASTEEESSDQLLSPAPHARRGAGNSGDFHRDRFTMPGSVGTGGMWGETTGTIDTISEIEHGEPSRSNRLALSVSSAIEFSAAVISSRTGGISSREDFGADLASPRQRLSNADTQTLLSPSIGENAKRRRTSIYPAPPEKATVGFTWAAKAAATAAGARAISRSHGFANTAAAAAANAAPVNAAANAKPAPRGRISNVNSCVKSAAGRVATVSSLLIEHHDVLHFFLSFFHS